MAYSRDLAAAGRLAVEQPVGMAGPELNLKASADREDNLGVVVGKNEVARRAGSPAIPLLAGRMVHASCISPPPRDLANDVTQVKGASCRLGGCRSP